MKPIYCAFDPASEDGDESCRVGYYYNDDGEIIIEEIKYIKKEVKKVNKIPYFEMKVVKVKKQPKDSATIYNQCPICKEIHKCNFKKQQPKGNWVNGENLDKIKFPVPCSYTHGTKKKGMLLKLGNSFYVIDIDRQGDYTKYFLSYDLKHLIKDLDIHILKGKIIIFDDDMEDKYSDE